MIETDAVVVGAGPVGLWQAFQLGLLEIATHVVDALPEAGASHWISAGFRSVTGCAYRFEPLNAKQLERSRLWDVSRWKRPPSRRATEVANHAAKHQFVQRKQPIPIGKPR